jgi:hypothetical protein
VDLARGARLWRLLALVACASAAAFAAPQSSSVTPTPGEATPAPTAAASASTGPTIEGDVTGGGQVGKPLQIRVDASMPGGWDRLHLVEATLLVDGRAVDHLTYDIEDAKASLDDVAVIAGTGGVATGDFLRVAGSQIALTTGGGNLSLLVDADVVTVLPEGARFELGVVGDRGETARITRTLEAPPTDNGLTWGSVITVVVIALLAGGFVGNIFASRRRPAVRPSVYTTIERRLDAERRSGGKK